MLQIYYVKHKYSDPVAILKSSVVKTVFGKIICTQAIEYG